MRSLCSSGECVKLKVRVESWVVIAWSAILTLHKSTRLRRAKSVQGWELTSDSFVSKKLTMLCFSFHSLVILMSSKIIDCEQANLCLSSQSESANSSLLAEKKTVVFFSFSFCCCCCCEWSQLNFFVYSSKSTVYWLAAWLVLCSACFYQSQVSKSQKLQQKV